MYDNIKRVTETRDIDEVNRLLSEGWKLLDTRHGKWGDYQWRGYLMGKAEAKPRVCAKVDKDAIDALTADFERVGGLANELNAALSELSKDNIRVLVELEDGDEPQQAAYMPLYDLDEHPELDPDKPEFCEREHRNMRRDLADRDFARKKNAEYREAGFLKGGGATQ